MVEHETIAVRTLQRSHWVDITPQVQGVIRKSSLNDGICTVSSLHTTAALTLNENADPDVARDFFQKLNELVPIDPQFQHSEGNSDSHIKTSLVGLSVQVPFRNKELILGTWQSIYICEFDGPRSRKATVTLIGE